jgi:methyltransferase (TIGR00027 family)
LVGTVGGRTQTIDAHVMTAVANGATQLILLGAGLDARPWRLAPVLPACRVFLVDHPASAAARARATEGLPARPDVRIDVDFAQDDLAHALGAAGVRTDRPTVVVWEGVSMYLPRQAVQQTLRALARCLAPGSTIVFDVWCPTEGWSAQLERLGRLGLRWLGEPLDFALPVEAIQPFLLAEGYTLEACIHAVDAARPFGGGGLPGLWFVSARINSLESL